MGGNDEEPAGDAHDRKAEDGNKREFSKRESQGSGTDDGVGEHVDEYGDDCNRGNDNKDDVRDEWGDKNAAGGGGER